MRQFLSLFFAFQLTLFAFKSLQPSLNCVYLGPKGGHGSMKIIDFEMKRCRLVFYWGFSRAQRMRLLLLRGIPWPISAKELRSNDGCLLLLRGSTYLYLWLPGVWSHFSWWWWPLKVQDCSALDWRATDKRKYSFIQQHISCGTQCHNSRMVHFFWQLCRQMPLKEGLDKIHWEGEVHHWLLDVMYKGGLFMLAFPPSLSFLGSFFVVTARFWTIHMML